MREVRKKSVAPVYGFAVAWLAYCLFFPLYKFWHFVILICVSVVVYSVMKLIFPDKVEYITEPEPEPEPVRTGEEQIDALLEEGERAVREMAIIRDSIKDERVKAKVEEIMSVTDKIFKDVLDDRGDYKQIKRFSDFYLPSTMKLLYSYDRFSSSDSSGANVTGTLEKIEEILDTIIVSYHKQYDALFANQALDIETDITVLESMLKKEGLLEKDF